MLAEKLGRNDLCSCGSGKKYKFCCLGLVERPLRERDVSFPTISEDFALGALLAGSGPFRAFYAAERPRIAAPIVWTDKLLMAPGIVAQVIRLPESGGQLIYLRRVPAAPADALAVAHELMHLVLDAEGFPFVAARSERQPLAALLNSLVHDPLIDARLRQYGFDIGRKVRKEIRAALAELPRAVPGSASRLIWVLNYAGQSLAGNVAAPDSAREQAEVFAGWFGAHHPSIAAEGDELLAEVERFGCDTPERMRAFFDWFARRYQLAGDLTVGLGGRPDGSLPALALSVRVREHAPPAPPPRGS
jgi:hypothetical protein